jgi:hypothetical protein
MAIYLDEDEVGADAATIGYPHLLLCMGVTVVMADGSLCGAHVSNASTETVVMGRLLADVNANGSGMSQLYCFADYAEHCGHHGCGDITAKAGMLGFHGPGYMFDFGYINPQDGAYVEITTNGAAAAATLRFKRNEKVDFTPGAGPQATLATKDWYGNVKTVQKATDKVAAAGKAKTFLGMQYGNHQIKAVPANALVAHAL